MSKNYYPGMQTSPGDECRLQSEVFCTLQVEGVHNWPECPFEEVIYLRDLHRHIFHIKAYMVVHHDDRDQEFIMLKHQIEHYLLSSYGGECGRGNYDERVVVFGAMSCEMIAAELIKEFGLSRCEVSEDNENGGIVTVF